MSEPPQPRVRPTSVPTLVVTVLLAGVAGWLLFARFYGSLPPLPLLPAITLAILAIVEGITALSTGRRIARKPGTEPVNPLSVARYVLIAKASSAAGALFTGLYAGGLLWLVQNRGQLASAAADVLPAAAGAVSSMALAAAALWLEHSCRIPPDPEDENQQKP
ncbi:membrane protein [Actinocatenispora thailandica]|uniref:Membrane protein n=1 Tax=Actinocatenispora thailandica TaxID=227318 RepID=A0A7R7HUB4_9ACTN|nr:DUF3180 domain-containing protein [Actinocatenispora thailandica]BCJ32662.1 membrane protein [Actinocatenispora thailandica]